MRYLYYRDVDASIRDCGIGVKKILSCREEGLREKGSLI